MNKLSKQFAQGLQRDLPKINASDKAWLVGTLQICLTAIALVLLLTVGFFAYMFSNIKLAPYKCGANVTGFETFFIIKHGENVHSNWMAFGVFIFEICVQCLAGVRLVDSTKENLLLVFRRNYATFWKQVTVGFLIIECVVCVVTFDLNIIRYYGLPVTVVRILFLYVVKDHLNGFDTVCQPIFLEETTPAMSKETKRIFVAVTLTVLGVLACCILIYKVILPTIGNEMGQNFLHFVLKN